MVKDRMGFIGGSDIAGIMGLSRWQTPLSVWAKKTGNDVRDDYMNEAIEMGIDLEDFVAKKFSQRTNLKMRRDERDFTHKDYPYMKAHIDRWIIGGMVLECKTCSAFKANEWDGDGIPREYYLQVNWYLGILEQTEGYFACLIGGQKFVTKKMTFSQELFDTQVDCAIDFWENYILPSTPPIAMEGDSDVLKRMFSEHTDTIRVVDALVEPELMDLVTTKVFLGEEAKRIKAEKDAVEAKIKQAIGGDLGFKIGAYTMTWKEQESKRVDTQKLKDDGVYVNYIKKTKSRTLRLSKKGKK